VTFVRAAVFFAGALLRAFAFLLGLETGVTALFAALAFGAAFALAIGRDFFPATFFPAFVLAAPLRGPRAARSAFTSARKNASIGAR
jgi:hypothetical protein